MRYFIKLTRRFHHSATFLNRERHRLLNIDVRAANHRVNRNPCALVRRRLAADAVELLRLDHFAEVVVALEPVGPILQIRVDARLKDIADGDQLRVFRLLQDRRNIRSAPAKANYADSHLLARRRLAVETERARRY